MLHQAAKRLVYSHQISINFFGCIEYTLRLKNTKLDDVWTKSKLCVNSERADLDNSDLCVVQAKNVTVGITSLPAATRMMSNIQKAQDILQG